MKDRFNYFRLSVSKALQLLGLLVVVILLVGCANSQTNSVEQKNLAVPGALEATSQDSQPIQQESQPLEPAIQVEEPVQPQEKLVVPTEAPVALTAAPKTAAVEASPAPTETVVQAADPQPNLQLDIKAEVGYQAPDFTLQTLTGQQIRLSDLRGRPVLINYWATWCIPCKAELPILEKLHQEYSAVGIQIITIDAIEQDTLDGVETMVSQMDLTMPVLLDHQNQFQSTYNQLFFPTSYFIDKNGVIRYIKLGDAPEEILRSNVEKLINNQL